MKTVIIQAGRLLGAAAGGGASFLWISAIWFPTEFEFFEGAYVLPTVILMAILALVGAIAAWNRHTKVMLIAFIACFLPVGITLLDAEGFLRYVGVLNIVLGIATALTALGHSMEKDR